ncbi:hypothetical protein GQ42DRAFT_120088, partial [Ramicandelaber brevisporus]
MIFIEENGQGGTRRRRKIPDPILTVLNEVFATNTKPTMQERHELAAKLQVPIRVVTVWFQNRRAKIK